MNLKFFVGVSILLLATWSFHSPAPRESGIEGRVLIGPMCPVAGQGQACLDQPYQATLSVSSASDGRILQIQTDGQGYFRIPLAPGQYTLHPESPTGIPFASDQTIVVGAGQYTQIMVHYDSGIR